MITRGSPVDWSLRLIPDVSLRTRAGLLALVTATAIGAAGSMLAIRLSTVRGGAPGRLPDRSSSPVSDSSSDEASFLAENRAAMATMMAGMDIGPTGDVDRDFVDMMVPHHQGAIDMATAVLRSGHNQAIRRLAQEIIITQRDEIGAMRLAVGEPPPWPSSVAARSLHNP